MAAKKSSKDVAQMTVAELRSRASELEITGRSSMKKDELRQAVIDAEEQTARLAAAKRKPKAKPRAQAAKTKANGAAKGNGAAKKSAAAKKNGAEKKNGAAKTAAKKNGTDKAKSADGMKPASEITAPSIGPHTVIEYEPPEERLGRHEPSEVDAMGLDKRRGVTGKRYGASAAKQATVYGAFIAVVAVLLIGAKLAADELDAPPETNPDEAPWSQPDAKQHPPTDIDFPRTISP